MPFIADTTAGPSTRDNEPGSTFMPTSTVSAGTGVPSNTINLEKEEMLFNHTLELFNSGICPELENLPEQNYAELRPCCKTAYERLQVDKLASINLCVGTASSKNLWEESRRYRITGSRCYEVFTSGQKKDVDWSIKASRYFWPKKFSTSATRHGITNEPHARELYARHFQLNVVEFGLVVNPIHPWLGYSPDGVVFEGDKPTKLIEIKCPVDGGKKGAAELIDQCSFLNVGLQGEVVLKEKHKYYGQVQLGMALLNVLMCDLVIYCPFDSSLAIVPVQYNPLFTKKMLVKLKKDYFQNMQHQICIKEMV